MPDDKDGFACADNALEELFEIIQWAPNARFLTFYFDEAGLLFDLITESGILEATLDLVNHMPHWVSNGWSPVEMM